MLKAVKEQVDKNQLYTEISETLEINKTIVRKICEKQFRTASDMIHSGKSGPVKFPYIGKMYRQI